MGLAAASSPAPGRFFLRWAVIPAILDSCLRWMSGVWMYLQRSDINGTYCQDSRSYGMVSCVNMIAATSGLRRFKLCTLHLHGGHVDVHVARASRFVSGRN